MKYKDIESKFTEFAKSQKLKIGEQSHFEGKQYKLHTPFTVSLKAADKRCGNRFAIALHLPNGCVHPLTSFLTPLKLFKYMSETKEQLKKEVLRYKKSYN